MESTSELLALISLPRAWTHTDLPPRPMGCRIQGMETCMEPKSRLK
jgi:hypothetical protein